jgi:catechol 2,3-dioxygenase-like lactoylglutathione lyase family enzyme
MLLDGVNHVALITDDTERFVRFYQDVFDAKVSRQEQIGPGTLTMVDVGPRTELNVFEVGDARGGLARSRPRGRPPCSSTCPWAWPPRPSTDRRET